MPPTRRFDRVLRPPQMMLEAAKRYPNAVIRQNRQGRWSLYPHGTEATAMSEALAELDRKPQREWPAFRGLAVVGCKFLAGVKWLAVWILTVVFLLEVLALDYLRDLGGARPERVDHAKRVRVSGMSARAADKRGIGVRPAILLFMCGIPLSIWLHFAAVSWLFGVTIFLS